MPSLRKNFLKTIQILQRLKEYADYKISDSNKLDEIADDLEYLKDNYKPSDVRGFLHDLDFRSNVIDHLIPCKKVGRSCKGEKSREYNLRNLVRDLPLNLTPDPEQVATFNSDIEKCLKNDKIEEIPKLFLNDL